MIVIGGIAYLALWGFLEADMAIICACFVVIYPLISHYLDGVHTFSQKLCCTQSAHGSSERTLTREGG
jgi:hypothetical protein